MKPQDARLGYLLVTTPIPNVYIGGLMVVDSRGLPVEFRYTEPIQPTKIQQILYGSVLGRYIKNEVILETLIKSLESKPALLVVNDESFLMKEAATRDYDVVRLTETKAPPLRGTVPYERISAQEFLLQLTAESSPVRVQMGSDSTTGRDVAAGAPKSLPDKSKEADAELENSEIYRQLLENGKLMDIMEPLVRVEKALSVLCQEAGIKAAAS